MQYLLSRVSFTLLDLAWSIGWLEDAGTDIPKKVEPPPQARWK